MTLEVPRASGQPAEIFATPVDDEPPPPPPSSRPRPSRPRPSAPRPAVVDPYGLDDPGFEVLDDDSGPDAEPLPPLACRGDWDRDDAGPSLGRVLAVAGGLGFVALLLVLGVVTLQSATLATPRCRGRGQRRLGPGHRFRCVSPRRASPRSFGASPRSVAAAPFAREEGGEGGRAGGGVSGGGDRPRASAPGLPPRTA